MSLLHFIYHTPVGSPTYLDLLPADVIGHHILPFLEWEDKIHVNMLTPPGDRTPPSKIPKERIIAHQLHMSMEATSKKIKNWDKVSGTHGVSQQRRVDALLDVLRTLNKGHNMIVAQHSNRLRDTIRQKMVEFSDPATLKSIRLLAQRREMQMAVQVILERMDAAPFVCEVKPNKWMPECVTQTETSLVYSGWLTGGVRVYREFGDIYTEWQ